MTKILITLSAFAVAASASAVLDLQFTIPADKTLVLAPGESGVISGVVTGVTGDVASLASLTNLSPANIDFSLTSEFQAYLDSNTDADYSGSILNVSTLATATPGIYYGGATISDDSPLADREVFAVQVTPEPGTFVALGLGAAALLRRRKRA